MKPYNDFLQRWSISWQLDFGMDVVKIPDPYCSTEADKEQY